MPSPTEGSRGEVMDEYMDRHNWSPLQLRCFADYIVSSNGRNAKVSMIFQDVTLRNGKNISHIMLRHIIRNNNRLVMISMIHRYNCRGFS